MIELARAKVESNILPEIPEVQMMKEVPITDDLREYTFIAALNDINMDTIFADQIFVRDLERSNAEASNLVTH